MEGFMMDTAWMIGNRGDAIPVVQHIYANSTEPEETLAAAQWLYKNTNNKNTKKLVLETIALWGKTLLEADRNNFLQAVQETIQSKPYRFLSETFVNSILPELLTVSIENLDRNILFEEVSCELNQEFLRARYGGIYHTNPSSKEMVFRISSICFNWYEIICEFLDKVPFQIDTITIIRDEESTGIVGGYYKTAVKEFGYYHKLPAVDFEKEKSASLMTHKNLTITTDNYGNMNKQIINELNHGKSFRDLRSLPINANRLADKLKRLVYEENKLVKGNTL